MTITETLNELYELLDSKGIDLVDLGVDDEEGLIILALNNLISNLDTIIEEISIDDIDEDNDLVSF